MRIRCLLLDDEPFALALLEKYAADMPELEVVASCKSPIRAIEILQSEPVDLLFLDVQMPILSGVNLLRSVSRRPLAVFTTAYPQHAVDAFDLDAVDYLLKPFSFERFRHAVAKAREMMLTRQGNPAAAAARPEGFLQIKADRRHIKIPLEEILYVEGWKEYVKIFTEKERFVTLESLSRLEAVLPAAHFLRVHKSFIVARARALRLEGDELLLGQARIPVARARKKAVVEALFEQ